MIRPIAAFLHALDAALDAGTLSRTVLVLSRQLDHAHLAGQIEEARADRAEERVAELELQLADWREASGELVAEQAAADLPDLEPADDSGPPSPLPADPYARAEIQAKRADAAERHRLAAETHAADLENELATVRAQLRQTERSAGAHMRTIEELRARLAVHVPAKEALQIPGVAAAEDEPLTESERREGYLFGKQTGIGFAAGCQAIAETKAARATAGTDERPPRIAPREVRYAAVMKVSAEIAAADTPPETQPSARITATAGVQS